MKFLRCLLLCGIMILTTTILMAQGLLQIPYQAILRTADGAILANQPVIIKATIVMGAPTGEVVFSETHSVVSARTGIISLAIGNGQSLTGNIAAIDWKSGLAYLKIEVDYQNTGIYILIGVSQILSVPYAIQSGNSLGQLGGVNGQMISHDGNVWLANDKVWINTQGVVIDGMETQDPLSSIFSIKNTAGALLFAVNQQGVKVNLMDEGENRGVLQITGLTSQNKYLILSPDSAKVQFNVDGVKAEKGGFAIGGLSNGKSVLTPYFQLNPSSTQLNFDKMVAAKAEKGGFAIGGLSTGKGYNSLFTINPDSTRFYLDTTQQKAEKGGFAIGGLSNGKTISSEFFRMSNVGAQLKFDETAGRAEKGGFAIGGLSTGKTGSHDYLAISELKSTISMVETNQKNGIGGLAIGGYLQNGEQFESFFNLTPDSININTGATSAGGVIIDGDVGTGGAFICRPQIETNYLAEYDSLSAVIFGSLLADGGGEVTAYGFVWNTIPQPTPTLNIGSCLQENVEFGSFVCNLAGLNFSTTYYVRAFATNSAGTAYGVELTFTTLSQTAIYPKALTMTPTEVTDVAAVLNGEIINNADSTILERGFVWSTKHNPTIASSSGKISDNLNESGIFSFDGIGLIPMTQYYVRAYVRHSDGVSYGVEVAFITLGVPYITTQPATFVSDVNATITALVTIPTGTTVLSLGFEYTTTEFVEGFIEIVSVEIVDGQESFEAVLTSLLPNTPYHARSFIEYSSTTIYGDVVDFTTQPSPSITTNSINSIGINQVSAFATVGLPENTVASKVGFLWSTSEDNPIFPTTDFTQVEIFSAGEFNDEITELTAETHYYLRAYIEHSLGYGYGNVLEFSTSGAARAITDSVITITATTAEVYAHIEYPESGIDTVGFEWSTYTDFLELAGSTETAYTGDENLTFSITELQPAMTYYVRAFIAYNQNEGGGNPIYNYIKSETIISFGTLPPDFGLVTLPIADVHPTGFTGSGRIMQPEPFLPDEVGFVISQLENPTVGTNEVKQIITLDNPDYFEILFTGLTTAVTYYLRIYIIYNDSVQYGEQQTVILPLETGTIFDIETNEYPIKYIGIQNWMTKNLRTTKYANNTSINPSDYRATETGNLLTYGYLYEFVALKNHIENGSDAKLCPTGWRLPTSDDYYQLTGFIGGQEIGQHLKDTTPGIWSGYPTTNSTGFAAVPGGYFSITNPDTEPIEMYESFGEMAYYATEPYKPYELEMWEMYNFLIYADSDVTELTMSWEIYPMYKSVRCIQNFEKLPKIGATITQEDPIGASAQILYDIISTGNAENGVQGLVWSYTENPTLENNDDFTEQRLEKGAITEVYESPLPFGTTIYFRAYAKSDLGTVYSQQIELQLVEPNLSIETFPVTIFSPNKLLAVGRINKPSELMPDHVGFVINSDGDPTLQTTIQNIQIFITGMDDFEEYIDSLDPSQIYYLRSYVKMGGYVKYGNVVSITLPEVNGTVIDIDNNEYPTKFIGMQNWMTVNLRVANYADNSPVSESEYVLPYWGIDSLIRHGYLYSQKLIANHLLNNPNSTICPSGWRLPNPDDWWVLIDNASPDNMLAAKYLKADDGWIGETETNDSVGFSALPTGNYNFEDYGEGTTQEYYGYGESSLMWHEPQGNNEMLYLGSMELNAYSNEVINNEYELNPNNPNSMFFSVRCIQKVITLPIIGENVMLDTTNTLFIVTYDIIADGGSAIGEQGVVWSSQSNPTISEHEGITTNVLKEGEFTEIIEGIVQGVTYYASVYAKNEVSIIYSNVVEFTASAIQSMFDIDRNKYPVVTIGEQDWMARNLRTQRYNNGDSIHWNDSIGAQDPHMAYTEFNSDEFGYLYNFGVINDTRGVCPSGFKIPHRDDWLELFDSVGGIEVAGGALKSTGTEDEEGFGSMTGLWNYPNLGATNIMLFNALATGYQDNWGNLEYNEQATRFWSSTLSDFDHTIGYELTSSGVHVTPVAGLNNGTYTSAAYSVRCVKIRPEKKYSATVLTNEITEYTSNSITVSGEVYDDGGGTISDLGFCYGTESNPSVEGNSVSVGTDPLNFTTSISGLDYATTYYVRAYVVTDQGLSYGVNRFVNTPSPFPLPTVETKPIHVSGANSAIGAFEIIDDGGAPSVSGGLVWSTNRNPSKYSNQGITTNADAIGDFVTEMNLATANVHYYVRAYAENLTGIVYGNEYVFTNNESYVLPIMEGTIQVMPVYQTWLNTLWGSDTETLATSDIDGKANTETIVSILGDNGGVSYAAKVCSELVAYNCDDWYLPSRTELQQMHTNRTSLGIPATGDYWSSTELNATNAYGRSFYNGSETTFGKTSTMTVRCVRVNTPVVEITPTVDYGGIITPNCVVKVVEGNIFQFSFSVMPWVTSSQLWIDGEAENDSTSTYTFENISGNHDIHLEVVVPEYSAIYSIIGQGFIDGDMNQTIKHLLSGTAVEAMPNEGWLFSEWSDGSKDNPRVDLAVTGNINVSAIFIEGVVDYDGNIYQTVNLGGFVWMTSNLKATHDQNGDTITGWAYYIDLPVNGDTYGLLYEWNDLINPCPVGFGFPADALWQQFEQMFFGMSVGETGSVDDRGTSGGALKEVGTINWQTPNVGATNSSGYTALPGGEYIDGSGYVEMRNEAHFWTSQENDAANAWYRKLRYDSNAIFRNTAPKTNKKSIRCVKLNF